MDQHHARQRILRYGIAHPAALSLTQNVSIERSNCSSKCRILQFYSDLTQIGLAQRADFSLTRRTAGDWGLSGAVGRPINSINAESAEARRMPQLAGQACPTCSLHAGQLGPCRVRVARPRRLHSVFSRQGVLSLNVDFFMQSP